MNLKNASPSMLMSCIAVLSTLSGCGRSVAEVAAVPATSAEVTASLRPSRLRQRPDAGLAHLGQMRGLPDHEKEDCSGALRAIIESEGRVVYRGIYAAGRNGGTEACAWNSP